MNVGQRFTEVDEGRSHLRRIGPMGVENATGPLTYSGATRARWGTALIDVIPRMLWQGIGGQDRGQFRAGAVPNCASNSAPLVGDLGGAALATVVRPGLGQVDLTAHQGAADRAGVGGEDADLAVLGAAGGLVFQLVPGAGVFAGH